MACRILSGRILIIVYTCEQGIQSIKSIYMKTSSGFQKWKTYLITFTSYMALHTMRMSYSQIKPEFQNAFQLSNLYLGLLDALVYLALGTGFFLRFLLEGKSHLTQSFLTFITISCIGYSVIPTISLALGEEVRSNFWFQEVLPGIGLLVFGLCQFPAWPTLLTLTSEHFDIKADGKAMGIWSANGDFGNIVGFGLTSILIDSLSFRWEIAMLAAASLNLSMALVFLFIREKPQVKNSKLQSQLLARTSRQEEDQQKHIKFKKFIAFVKKVIKPRQNKLYLLSMGLLKSILYGFLLWMPTYLAHNDMGSYKATIPIVFNAGTLLGSFLLGHLYQDLKMGKSKRMNNLKGHIKSYALFYSCIGVVVTLTIFYVIRVDITVYFILSGVCGAFLGGCFNMLASNEVIAITGGKKDAVNFLSTLSMVVGNLTVGVVQIIIGVVFNVKDDPEGEQKLFLILMAVGTIAIVILFWRSRIISKNRSYEQAQVSAAVPFLRQEFPACPPLSQVNISPSKQIIGADSSSSKPPIF